MVGQDMSDTTTTAAAKQAALDRFLRRLGPGAKLAESAERCPQFYYCPHCGAVTDMMFSDYYTYAWTTECNDCRDLKEKGWLEDAKECAKANGVDPTDRG